LTEGSTYQVLYAEDHQINDLTGQVLQVPTDRVVGEFTVTTDVPVQPRLLTSFPVDASTGASAITTFVAVFDRPLNTPTVNATTFRVTVDGGAPPINTGPVVLQVDSGFGGSTPEPRVFLWRAQDSLGDRLPLGNSASVSLDLSNDGGGPTIEDLDGGQMAARTVGFTTAATPPPIAAQITSLPGDAIGIANLDGTRPLQVQVDLELPAVDGDVLEIYLVGRDKLPDSEGLPRDSALLRSFPLTGGTVSVILGEAELQLAATTSPVAGVFKDGSVNFGFLQVASGSRTPLFVLDTDLSGADVIDPIFDTEAPKPLSIGHLGITADEFRSDLRDLVVNGSSDDVLRSVEVRMQVGLVEFTNGVLPPVASFDEQTGGFIAKAAPLGVLDPTDLPGMAEITLYDRALNASGVIMVPFYQLGGSGPAAALPGPDVTVTVFDSASLLPIVGARVFTHEDDTGVVSAIATATTDRQGQATLSSALVGETIVTVDTLGYDLFSFHGAPTARLDVPLVRSGFTTAVATPAIAADFEEVSSLENAIIDTRVPFPLDQRSFATSCFFNPFSEQTACTFDPYAIASDRLGGLVQLSTLTPAAENLYSAESFLRGFGWFAPRPSFPAGALELLQLDVASLLSDVATPPEERAIDAPLQLLNTSGAVGVDLGNLTSDPVVRVEALTPGLTDNSTVGTGIAFDLGGGTWKLRAAYPGAADGILDGGGDLQGSLVTVGAIEGDLFFGAEIADITGNRSARRPRFSFATGNLDLPAVSAITAPLGATGGPSFDIEFDDVVPDSLGQPGLYQVVVIDGAGRAWRVWRLDPPDANGPTVRVHLPDIAFGGGTPLIDGVLAASITSYSIPGTPGSLSYTGFDPLEFMWSDIERQRDRRSVGAPVLLSQP